MIASSAFLLVLLTCNTVTGPKVLLSAEGYQSQQVIDTAEITATDGNHYISLDNQKDTWPIGYYEIRLSVNGTLVE